GSDRGDDRGGGSACLIPEEPAERPRDLRVCRRRAPRAWASARIWGVYLTAGGFHRWVLRSASTYSEPMRCAGSDAPSSPGALPDVPGPPRRWRRATWIVIVGAALAVVFLGLRYRLAVTPPLAETYYDEALTGLMAIAILHGSPQVFYWGEP